MHDSRRIFEYFLVGGLPENPVELTPGAQECGYRDNVTLAPITDIAVIYPSLQETIPDGFECVETTPTGHPADLNHGSLRSPSCYLCYRRGFHKPPIVDIGILYDGKGDTLMRDSFVLKQTPNGHMANLNNAKDGIFLTYRRAANNAPSNLLAVSDICVILANKGETAPHTFYKINKNLNKGLVGSDVYLCYKKSLSNVNRIAYMPAMLDRFPLTDFADYPLPTNVPIFCLPMGAVVECWPTKCQTPGEQFSTFILTDQNGHKLYGASVSFYEDYEKPLTNEQMEKLGLNSEGCYLPGSCSDSSSTNDPADQMTFHTNKCICVVSRYPFFSAFRRYLLFLHRMCMGSQNALPVERYISFLMFEVPFPTFLRPRVLVELGNERICFDNPEDSPLPLSAVLFAPPESPTQNAKNAVYYCYDRKFPRLQQALFQLGSSGTPVDPRRSTVPQSPVPLIAVTPAARRTKQETKLALDFAKKQLAKPLSWAKCLLGYSYSLWFIHLPAFMRVTVDKNKALNAAYCILKRMESAKLASPDEVCYRVLIQMCGLYENPILAVKVFVSMNQNGVRPNAVTYGIYNRAVLEAKWPGVGGGLPAQKRWALLRNVIHAIALMQHGHLMANSASQSSRSHNIRVLAKNNISLHHRIANADAADATTKAAHTVTDVEQKSKIQEEAGEEEEEEEEEEKENDDVVEENRKNCLEYNESCIDRNDSLTTVSDTDLMPMKEEEKQQYPMQTSDLNSSSMIEAGNLENYLFNSEMKLSNSNEKFCDHECCREKDVDENNICKNELDNFTPSTVMQSEVTAVDDDNFMDSHHPLEIDIDEQQQQQQSEIMKIKNVKASVEMKLSSPTGRPLDKYDCTLRPLFVDEPQTPPTQQKGSSKHSFSGSGLSRFGRQSMRDFFTRINEVATPVSRFVRTARHVDNNAMHIRESKTSEEDINVASDNNLRSPSLSSERSFALSPYLSDRLSNSFAEAQNKMFSKMSQFQQSSNSFAKLKSGMSLMVHEIRNFKSPYQLSGQVRGSWSSLSLNDNNANNNNISEGRSSVDDGYSTKNSCHGCIDEYSGKMELPLDDPAFALSSGMVNRMLNFSAMNGNDGGVSSCQVEVLLCTTSRCPSCKYLVYDDEIMAGWSADDSELNTTCPFCDMKFVPKLTAVLQPLRSLALNSWYVKESASGAETTIAEDEVGDEDEVDNNVQDTAEKMDKEKISVSEGCSKSLDALHGFGSSSSSGGGGGGGGGLSTKGHHHQWSKMSRQISLSYGNFFTTFGRSSAKRPSRQRMVSRQLFRETDDVGGRASRPGSFPSLCQENGNAVDEQKRRHVITVHYLNLIVLRKALENVVISDGDGVLTLDEFLETKPILFWNLVYVFQRLGVPTHLVSCAGRFYVSKFYGDVSEPVPGVTVRCVHELPTLLHLDAADDGQQDCHNYWPKPVYWSLAEQAGVVELGRMVSAEHRFVTRALVGQIVESLSGQNLTTPLQLLINEYRRQASRGTSPTLCLPKHFSMYRDMLFVALLQFGHKLRVEEFDLRYRAAFGKLSPKIAALLPVHDHPPSWSTIACRLVFIPLDVL
ncbi:C-myc promoter-binding protein [Trichinella pseudospiralis]|uniref:C-myc promoter-binding protein n=1 Tax=Trichinella pseudospiralis TaxID=6337 RepID=A0A0V0YGW6_TRIPS|nr:C-myc promoter-binding protein [Trichinella pseudospiralis]